MLTKRAILNTVEIWSYIFYIIIEQKNIKLLCVRIAKKVVRRGEKLLIYFETVSDADAHSTHV